MSIFNDLDLAHRNVLVAALKLTAKDRIVWPKKLSNDILAGLPVSGHIAKED